MILVVAIVKRLCGTYWRMLLLAIERILENKCQFVEQPVIENVLHGTGRDLSNALLACTTGRD